MSKRNCESIMFGGLPRYVEDALIDWITGELGCYGNLRFAEKNRIRIDFELELEFDKSWGHAKTGLDITSGKIQIL